MFKYSNTTKNGKILDSNIRESLNYIGNNSSIDEVLS